MLQLIKLAKLQQYIGLMLNCLSNDIIRKPTLKTFYKAMTDTSEGYVSSFTGVPLP